MKNLKKLLALLLALVMVVGIMAGCTGGEDTTPSDEGTQGAEGTEGTQGTEGTTAPAVEDEPQYGGHLRVKCNGLNHLDPTLKLGVWHYLWTTCVYEPPLTRDLDNNIQPGVCDFELAEDELSIKLWVRDGKTFHNGDPVDIYDVKATIERSGVLYESIGGKFTPFVKSMEVDEEGKVLTIEFTEWRESIYYYLAAYQTWMGVIPKEICEKYPDTTFQTVEDAIGTGPYRITEYVSMTSLSIEKWDDYVIPEEDYEHTGFAGAKYAYLDSMEFISFSDQNSATMGLLSGDIDVIEAVASDYKDMWESAGIKESRYPSLTGNRIKFNTYGTNNVCAKYPSLRKAVMAAINYDDFLKVVTDNQHIMGGYPIVNKLYETDVFEKADYYGEDDLEVASKYIEAAKAEGWNGTDPVTYVDTSFDASVSVLLKDYLGKAGIPFETIVMESTARNEYVLDPENNWDLMFDQPTYALSPTLMAVSVSTTWWNNPEKEALLQEMAGMKPGSEEYMAAWDKLADYWVDDCCVPYMSMIDWFWYHDEDLVTNDDEQFQRSFFNSYWKNPEEHVKD